MGYQPKADPPLEESPGSPAKTDETDHSILADTRRFLVVGCATRHGTSQNGRSYQEYDILFDRNQGVFQVLLEDISFNGIPAGATDPAGP